MQDLGFIIGLESLRDHGLTGLHMFSTGFGLLSSDHSKNAVPKSWGTNDQQLGLVQLVAVRSAVNNITATNKAGQLTP